jgi:hypothetical protein
MATVEMQALQSEGNGPVPWRDLQAEMVKARMKEGAHVDLSIHPMLFA